MEELKNEKKDEKAEETKAIEEKHEDLIESLQRELAQQKEKYLRLYAEFENYKKVSNKEKEEIINHANEKLIAELLPVIDNFELAIKHASNENEGWLESLKTGLDNTLKEFLRVLEKFGLKQIETVGKPFNPEFHHAVATTETSEKEENMVVEELRKGYLYRDKVLRASLVTVSKKPKPSSEGEISEKED
uniref:Protein GrpE n=1 Tax=Thermodesulfovibrio aggregans TaxID=86166 RepID=A0A7C4ELW1_9BACT